MSGGEPKKGSTDEDGIFSQATSAGSSGGSMFGGGINNEAPDNKAPTFPNSSGAFSSFGQQNTMSSSQSSSVFGGVSGFGLVGSTAKPFSSSSAFGASSTFGSSSLFGGTNDAPSSFGTVEKKPTLFGAPASDNLFSGSKASTSFASNYEIKSKPSSSSSESGASIFGASSEFKKPVGVFGVPGSITSDTASKSSIFGSSSNLQSTNAKPPPLFSSIGDNKSLAQLEKPPIYKSVVNEQSLPVNDKKNLFSNNAGTYQSSSNTEAVIVPNVASQKPSIFGSAMSKFNATHKSNEHKGDASKALRAKDSSLSHSIPLQRSTGEPTKLMKNLFGPPTGEYLSSDNLAFSHYDDRYNYKGNSKRSYSVDHRQHVKSSEYQSNYSDKKMHDRSKYKLPKPTHLQPIPSGSRQLTSYGDLFSSPSPSGSLVPPPIKRASPVTAEKAEPTVIIATGIPDDYLDKNILKNHFEKFGKIVRLSLHASANQAQVTFETHEAAALAKKKGKSIHPNIPSMMILFGTALRSKPEDTSQTELITQKRNNAMKVLRQSSTESHSRVRKNSASKSSKPGKVSPEMSKVSSGNQLSLSVVPKLKTTKDSSKGSKEWLKPSSSRSVAKRNYSDIPTDLSCVAVNKNLPSSNSERSSPLQEDTSLTVTAKDFNSLRSMRAFTSQEKYNLLNARDKLLRRLQKKVLDVNKAKYLTAACPDMCPEKERYMREIQNDLSPYEMSFDRKAVHEKVVKKFSRSSADKDEPLPHELRTGPVLTRTMDYLLTNILPEMEENTDADLDVCYNYLWDRTRAMRSDITQQHLVDHCAVYVLERCVRFHIFASERLCVEPPHIFDPKMNSEHLRKSMQTLKELYYDLSQNNLYFGSESEFRAYEILMNVEDSNIMFSYLLLREEVRTSPEVKFAINVLNAIQSRNYIRFFQLLEKASFLQACLMHKYFNKVRSVALDIMIKAFHAIGDYQGIPLSEIVCLMAFESREDALDFISTHNLKIDSNECVTMNRNSFVSRPEVPAQSYRALTVIGNKKNAGIASELNGGVLPTNPLALYLVHDSFNPDGSLKSVNDSGQGPPIQHPTETDQEAPSSKAAAPIGSTEIEPVADASTAKAGDVPMETQQRQTKQVDEETKESELLEYENSQDGEAVEEKYETDTKTQEEFEEGYGGDEGYDDQDNNYDEGSGFDYKNFGEESQEYDGEAEEEEPYYNEADVMESEEVDDTADLQQQLDKMIQLFVETKENELLKKSFKHWQSEVKFASNLRQLVFKLTRNAVYDEGVDWRYKQGIQYNEFLLKNLFEFKLMERCFLKWKVNARNKALIHEARNHILSRRVVCKWRKFVEQQKYKRYIGEVQKVVKSNLDFIAVKKCVRKWRRMVIVSKLTRHLTSRRQKRIGRTYFQMWQRRCKENEWKRKRYTDGFPAGASRLSLKDQNKLWGVKNIHSRSKTFSDLQGMEAFIEEQRAKHEVARNLSHEICRSPLPISETFERFINSSDVPNSLKPKKFILVFVFSERIDKYVEDWFRLKVASSKECPSTKIDYSITVESAASWDKTTITFKESTKQDIAKESDISCIYYVTDKDDELGSSITYFNNKGIMADVLTITLNRQRCLSPVTSSQLMDQMISSYKKFSSCSSIVSSTLPQVTCAFTSKHVLQAFLETERLGAEFGLVPLPPSAYNSLLSNSISQLTVILCSQSLRGKEWLVSVKQGEPAIRKQMDTLQERKISEALQTLRSIELLSKVEQGFELGSVKTWTEATDQINDILRKIVSEPDQLYRISSDVTQHIEDAKEYFMKRSIKDDDSLDTILAIPWRNIYCKLITYKLSALPELNIIYNSDEMSSFSVSKKWHLPYLVPFSSNCALWQSSKRKAPQIPTKEKLKKRKSDSEFLKDITEEKKKLAQFEARLQSLLDGKTAEELYGLEDAEGQTDPCIDCPGEENRDEDDLSLRSIFTQEKENYKALEEKLRNMLN